MDAAEASQQLQAMLQTASQPALSEATARKFAGYFSLYQRWNARLNLSAVRNEIDVLSIHLFESIIVSRYIPMNVHSLLDFGSGAGLPGIPIALCRPEIAVTMAESQGKKAAFLQEAVRESKIEAQVYGGRAETLEKRFDCVTLRAVDRMQRAVAAAAQLVAPSGWLAPLTTRKELPQIVAAAGRDFSFGEPIALPGSMQRVLALAQRQGAREPRLQGLSHEPLQTSQKL